MWARAGVLLAALGLAGAQVLSPPIFNLAENKAISATSTCGEDVTEPELFCQLTGGYADKELKVQLIQGQVCDYCDPSDPDRAHPAENAIDGSERWWQSPPLSRGTVYNAVNVTIDLGQEFHVAYVFIRMANSPRPGVWVLERSRDHGQTYEPWSYFADSSSDCEAYFGPDSLKPLTEDDSVRCETQYSKVVPLQGGEIPYSLLNGRPSKDQFYNSTVLQRWTRATNIRLRLLRAKTLLGHLMSVAQQVPTVTRRYYYSIKDISVGGRCVCNGHADLCDPSAEDQYRLLCRCHHNTCGSQCEVCCPPYVQKKWKPAAYADAFVCEACNCYGHSNDCVYSDEVEAQQLSLDIHGNYEGGGVCQYCRHHTTGINCHQCEDGYFRPFGVALDAQDVCQPCDCDVSYSTGNCAEGTGQCECRPAFQPPDCTDCSYGYYGYPDCRPCDCNLNGTRSNVCEVGGGQCPCKPNFDGHNCDRCAPGYFNFPICEPCECNSVGSLSDVCSAEDDGQCDCLNNFGGRRCDQCQNGYFLYPDCEYCKCDSAGTEAGICDKEQGTCLCREGFGGDQCDQCASGFYGYHNCRPCDCYVDGSTSTSCSISGKCSCLSSFSGQQCDQCSPGYFNFPECRPCSCDPSGAIGLSCNGDGTCQCKANFDGEKCERCRENFYNFPLCEDCNCDPAGVTSSFAGCGSLEHLGELCECKPHVTGRICNTCRPLFWNLRLLNPDGCQDCDCNPSGTVGGVRVCDARSGQCACKPHVTSRQCQECSLGAYRLTAENLLGCQTCNCDIGGALNDFCDKYTGQCTCRPRITGPSCKEPLQLHYFPTLYQYKYEAEDGRTAANSAVRFGYDQREFPDYSWRGYAVFSPLQREIIHDIWVEKPSLYRMVMRYVNPTLSPIIGDVLVTPENPRDVSQTFKVRFEPSREATLVTVSGSAGDLPSPLVLNPGLWTVTVQNEIEGLRLDYFALLPAAYYEGTVLQDRATEPCFLQELQPLCLHYAYPDLSWAAGTAAAGGQAPDDSAIQLYDNQQVLDTVEASALARLDEVQSSVRIPLSVDSPGRYVLVVIYLTAPGESSPRQATVEMISASGTEQGTMDVNRCDITTLCRQVVLDQQGRVYDFNLDSTDVDVIITSESGAPLLVDSVLAVPARKWHMDYIQPRVRCIRESGECIDMQYPAPPQSSKVEFELGLDSPPTVAPGAAVEEGVQLVRLDGSSSMVDVRGTVPDAGQYVFIVHYYQPNHPEFEMQVLLQNGQFYEAKLRVPHCPSNSGCRAVVEEANGNKVFNILDSFLFTLKEPNGKDVMVDYLYAVPEAVYNWELLEPLQVDRSVQFLQQCGQDHFMVDTADQGFCRDAVFSLTTDYNNGALQCQCDSQGSSSFECAAFGGQCPCKTNVVGRQCNRCRTGHFGFPDCQRCDCPSTALCDDNTGECICPPRVSGEQCDQCVPLTYGFDPLIGCDECNCHQLGVASNDLQCDLETGQCPCKPNIVSRTCDLCQAGSWAYPYCQLCNCDQRGTTEEICSQETAECFCKDNVDGRLCDECLPGTYNLAETNPDGCTRCFCFGKTESCTSSFLFWTEIRALEEMEWDVSLVTQTSTGLSLRPSPVTLEVYPDRVRIIGGQPGDVSYFVPSGTSANMLTSYGGQLRYTVTPEVGDSEDRMSGPDVILKGANMTLLHYAYADTQPGVRNEVVVELEERFFRLPSGPDATREQLMQVLQKMDGLFIKATYLVGQKECSIYNVTLNAAVAYGDPNYDPVASSVEECACPSSYTGLSCEECAPGHYRAQTGPFGGYCVPCNCNGHSDKCDPLTGRCFDCDHSTTGDHCELCISGYHGDATGGSPYDCLICACPLPMASNNFADSCEVSPDGLNIRCQCQPGYYGARCEACAAGYFGSPETPGGHCQPCQCSSNIDPDDPGSCDSVTGDCLRCLNNTDGPACNLCARGYYGDAVVIKDCQSCNCDQCGTARCNSQTGFCDCKPNVEGNKCDRCAPNCWGFQSCQGCRDCECAAASESTSCDYETGQCRCRPGAAGRRCEQCAPGFWNYGPTGCQSCNCNQDYAYGVGCNPETGQCECLRGVEGPRCERCPYRWILIPGQGCEECDSCVHDLLDSTDSLESIVRPIMDEFESYAGSYFLNQKLNIMNETYNRLRPQVEAISGGGADIDPLALQVGTLERQAKANQIQAEAITGRAQETQRKAVKVRDDSKAVEEQINEAVREARNIVRDIISLAQGLKVGAGPQIDLALSEAERLLDQIRSRDFGPAGRRVEEELEDAILLLERVRQFSDLISERWGEASGLRVRLTDLERRLADLREKSSKARDQALQTLELISNNRIQIINDRVNDVGVIADATEDRLDATAEWLDQARRFLAEARATLATLQLQAERVLAFQQAVDIKIDEMTEALSAVSLVVRQAQTHATDLMMQAQMLDNMLADTRFASEGAIRAANSYKDIVTAINEALQAARAALEAADQAGEMSDGVGDQAFDSRKISEQLLTLANGLLERVLGELRPQLDAAKLGVNLVEDMNRRTRQELTVITESLTILERYQLETEARDAARVATDANAAALDALDRVADISARLPSDLEAANGLAREMDDARKAIQLASEQIERVEGVIPSMKTLITSVDEKYTLINVLGADVGDKLAELRRKVAVAREKTNSIGVGVRFSGDMTLQLKNPDGLDRSATSTEISFFFRTDQPNGFLLYLGNEVGTKDQLRRVTSDDFIAAEVIQGNLNVLADLGSGAQRIINDGVYVSDGVWRQAVITRKGRQVKVKVVTEDSEGREKVEEVESILPGSKSVLNLDQAKSVLHVGGFPTSAKVQDNVRYTTFEGAIEDLKINDVPVGLWNFASQTNLENRGAMIRDKLVRLVPASGLRFNGDGYAAFITIKHTFKNRFSLQLRFKTFSEDGLLFLAGKGMSDFLSVEMIGGGVVFQFSLGDGPLTLRGAGPYNDGQWHVLEAAREERDGVLKVDSQIVDQGASPGNSRDLSVSEMMYFGGYPGNVPYQEVVNSDFEGCLDEVYVSGSSVNLGLSKEALGVSPGCPARVATDVSFDANNPGHVTVPVEADDFKQLTVKFKTVQPDGLLFYSTNRDRSQYLSLSLVGGGLVLRSSPGGEASTTTFSRYDDDQWHVVTASLTNDNILLEIDDYETFQLANTVPGLSVRLHSPIYFGGVPASLQPPSESAGSLDGYAGCLGDATVNSVFVNFADATERANAKFEKCPLSMSAPSGGQGEPTLIDLSEADKEEAPSPSPEVVTEAPAVTDASTHAPPTEPPTEPPTTPEPTTARTRRPPPEQKRQCALPLRPNEDETIAAYSGQRFGNRPDSRWEFVQLPGKYYVKSSISVEFKTTAREGIIFYAGAENQIDFLALYLKDGNIVYAFDCGSGAAVISSAKAYNDDQWHTARFNRSEKVGFLFIDDVLVGNGESVGNSLNIQVDPPYFLGGLSEEIKENERLQGNVEKIGASFNGCLRNLRMNDRPFGNPAKSVVVTPCSDQVEQGAFFSVEGGHMIADKRFRVGQKVQISLDIRPRRLGGVLLAVHGKKDFLMLQMHENGSLRLTVENGRGEMINIYTPQVKHELCNGQWHSIKVVKLKNVAALTVDGFTGPAVFGVAGVSSTDTNSPFYVGGVPNKNVRGLVTQTSFVGCIRNLVVLGRPDVGLRYARVVGAVTANTCPLL